MKAVLLLAAALAGAGCTLFDGDPPSRACRSDNDCFRAQGERCNQASKTCEVMLDAGVEPDAATIDAGPEPDAAEDAGPDAPVDADVDAMVTEDAS